jgi:hypothetical protein
MPETQSSPENINEPESSPEISHPTSLFTNKVSLNEYILRFVFSVWDISGLLFDSKDSPEISYPTCIFRQKI